MKIKQLSNERKKTNYVILFFFLCGSASAQNKEITISVNGFNSDKGKCIIYVFNKKQGFPDETKNAVKTISCNISDGKCATVLKDLPDGEYAISILHDENSNAKIDTNFFGIPKEGSGASNNPKSSDGPPTYTDAKFKYTGTTQIMGITVKYL
jgi:uncharacterized protein (DUF2141 family)